MGTFFELLLIDSISTLCGPIPLLTLCLQGGASFEIVFVVALFGSLRLSCLGYTLGYDVWTSQINRELATTKISRVFCFFTKQKVCGCHRISCITIAVKLWHLGSEDLCRFIQSVFCMQPRCAFQR